MFSTCLHRVCVHRCFCLHQVCLHRVCLHRVCLHRSLVSCLLVVVFDLYSGLFSACLVSVCICFWFVFDLYCARTNTLASTSVLIWPRMDCAWVWDHSWWRWKLANVAGERTRMIIHRQEPTWAQCRSFICFGSDRRERSVLCVHGPSVLPIVTRVWISQTLRRRWRQTRPSMQSSWDMRESVWGSQKEWQEACREDKKKGRCFSRE